MKTPASLQTILDTASQSGRHVAGLRGDLRSRLAAFRLHRSSEEQAALEENFDLVLTAWGIADADTPAVVSALRLRLLVFAFPALACLVAAAWSQSLVTWLSLACVAPPCLLGLVTTLWRISILRNRRFKPLCRWLLRFRKRR